jgi:hypothetical protein
MKINFIFLLFISFGLFGKQHTIKIIKVTKLNNNEYLIRCNIRNYYNDDTVNSLFCKINRVIAIKKPIAYTNLLMFNIFKFTPEKKKNTNPLYNLKCHIGASSAFERTFITKNIDSTYEFGKGKYLDTNKPFYYTIENENIILDKFSVKDFIITLPETKYNNLILELEFKMFETYRTEYIFIDKLNLTQ